MPILKLDDAPDFDLSGVRIRGLASPSRGATEVMTYLVEMSPGQRVPDHTHDHEEVSYVLSGRCTISIEHDETMLQSGDTVMIPSGIVHRAWTDEQSDAVVLVSMPSGTILIRGDGSRVPPPWGT